MRSIDAALVGSHSRRTELQTRAELVAVRLSTAKSAALQLRAAISRQEVLTQHKDNTNVISNVGTTNHVLTSATPPSPKPKPQQEDARVELAPDAFDAPDWCVPIRADVRAFEWETLARVCQFDVVLMDPPWQLASQQPTRGVAIGYQQLPDAAIEAIPLPMLQTNGFIFLWVINNKYVRAFELLRSWGYEYVDDITWVKQTVNRRMAKGHGYYLQHAKETCIVGRKGIDPPGCQHSVASDVIFSPRRGQSQKPEELYTLIEQLVPNGRYLEIFGRKNNLRDFWVTIGNEL